MSDLIRRQDAIDAIGNLSDEMYRTVEKGATFPTKAWFDGMAQAEHIVKNLPSAQPEPKWIPCSERLPKYGKNVLITNDKGNVSYGRFRGVEFWQEDGDAHWHWKHNTTEHVLAWMPLPEPWKGEER